MSRSIAAATVLALVLIGGGGGGASAWWWDQCDCDAPNGGYEPPPVYVYDHSSGPTWTGNGWANLPIGAYRPRPEQLVPPPQLPAGYGDNRARERIWHGGLLPYW